MPAFMLTHNGLACTVAVRRYTRLAGPEDAVNRRRPEISGVRARIGGRDRSPNETSACV